MSIYPLTVLLEVDDLDRRIALEATQTAGDAVLAYVQANPALYGAADRLYPGTATIRIDGQHWRVSYGWRGREAFVQELQVAAQQPAQAAATLVQSIGSIALSQVITGENSDGGRYARDQLLKALLLRRGIFCPDGAFFSVPDQAAHLAATTEAAVAAQPELYALVILGLAFASTAPAARR